MSAARQVLPTLVAGALALGVAAACGGDSSGPDNGPASVTGITGDNQSAPTGAVLTFPLSFTVLDGNGLPFGGATVAWTVTPASGAAFNPANSTTDENGIAETLVTLGNVVGDIVIRGTVAGLQPVTFHAVAISPCSFYTSHTFGTTVNGTLTTFDCNELGYYTDFYEFSVASQQGIAATMTASFDTWLDMYTRSGPSARTILGVNDDISGANLNSQILTIVAPGSYALGANTAFSGVTGTYSLATVSRPQAVGGCLEVYVTFNVSFSDSVTTADCVESSAAGSFYGDLIGLVASPGQTIELTLRSTVLDPALRLYRATSSGLVLLTSNDDSLGLITDAFISYDVTSEELFVIFTTTSDSAVVGGYTLTVGATTGPSPRLLPLGRSWRPDIWNSRQPRLLPLAPRTH